jgi:hypothetical protein
VTPSAPEPARAESPARKRFRRREIIGVFLAIIGLLVMGVVGYKLAVREQVRAEGKRELAQATAETERTDPNWTWERVNAGRQHVPPEQNAAELIPRIRATTHPDWGKRLSTYVNGERQAKLDIPPNVRFSPSVLAEARRDLATSAEAVRLARTLKTLPRGRRDYVLPPNYDNLDLSDTGFTSTVTELLHWDVVIALEDGDRPRAADGLLASLNASRSIGDEPFVISQLARGARRSGTIVTLERALAQSGDLPGLPELQAALTADAEEPLLLNGYRGERAALDQLFDNLQTGVAGPDSFKPEPLGTDGPKGRFVWWHYRGWLPRDRAFALAWMTRCVELAKRPIHEQIAPFRAMRLPAPEELRVLSRLLLEFTPRFAEAYWRDTAKARCAVAGIACERFRQKHGRWPESLAELVPAFLPAVPLDPYDGEPLRYAKSETGAAVSSVGVTPPNPVFAQLGKDLPPSKADPFRLWNPDQRRLPPLPDPPEPPADP